MFALLAKPLLLYYLSAQITDPSPALGAMETIAADSPSEGAERLSREGRIPAGGACHWSHFLAQVDEDGVARGFESVRLPALNSPDGD